MEGLHTHSAVVLSRTLPVAGHNLLQMAVQTSTPPQCNAHDHEHSLTAKGG